MNLDILENLPIAMCVINRKGKNIRVNQALSDLTGYRREDLLSADTFMFFVESDVPLTDPEQFFSSNEHETYQRVLIRRADGVKRICDVYLSDYEDEDIGVCLIVSLLDITFRVEAERDLRKQEENLNYAQEIARMGSWEFSLITGKYEWSRSNYIMVGMAPFETEVTIPFFLNMVHPDDRQMVQDAVDKVIATLEPGSINIRLILKSGETLWLQNNIVPMIENQNLIGVKGVNIDITDKKIKENEILELNVNLDRKVKERTAQLIEINENLRLEIEARKKAEEEMIHARAEAEKANTAKSDFLSKISHELRTPLNSIIGFAQLLNLSELKENQKKNLSNIIIGGNHLLNLINEILDIERIEAGHIRLQTESVRIDNLITEVIESIEPEALNQKVNIVFNQIKDYNCSVLADRQKLKQVLINLLNNSVKYNREGGSVEVTVTCRNDQVKPGSFIRVSVSDSGIGIPESDLRRIFDPFVRINPENSQIEGTGLGLTLVKTFIEAMDGEVGISSEFGVGSTFWFDLPGAFG